MSGTLVFDQEHYRRLNESREERVRELLAEATLRRQLHSAIDVGCGAGYFSRVLEDEGLEITIVDGRSENVEEARKKVPRAKYKVCNVEAPELRMLGEFDLVLCFGLLYHLENPLQAIRNLRAITARLLLAESVIFSGKEPVMALVDEGFTQDQGLNHIAFYPTESCLVKMFYTAGYRNVYEFNSKPKHPYYHATGGRRRVRTMLAASTEPIASELLSPVAEPHTGAQPWDPTEPAKDSDVVAKLKRFIRKPFPEKLKSIKKLANDE